MSDVRVVVMRAMERRQMSQVELARRAGVDRSRMNRWLREHGTLRVSSLEAIMEVLGLELREKRATALGDQEGAK